MHIGNDEALEKCTGFTHCLSIAPESGLSFLVLEYVVTLRINLHVFSECGPGDPPRDLIILLFVWLVRAFVNISSRWDSIGVMIRSVDFQNDF
jgi:hypothetical protein